MLDLILLDRLNNLQDQDASHSLRLSPEVPVSADAHDIDGNVEIIRGRVDWALNYTTSRLTTGSILIVIEAKRIDNVGIGLPQLLVYMIGVLESRRDRKNQSVFGILSDTGTFQFAFLDHNKKFYVSRSFEWLEDRSKILAHIDTILLDAIESSPHTTPTKVGNTTLLNYQRYLKKRWTFGDEPGDETSEGTDEDSIVDVIDGGRDLVIRTFRKEEPDQELNSGAAGV
jgi:hypothetical protein